MYTTINKSAFMDAFHDYDRYDQFGYDALSIIFDYLKDLEEDGCEQIELDVVAICCDYAVADVATIAQDYNLDVDGLDEDEAREVVEEYLNENTSILGTCDDGQIVYCTTF
jgi:methionine synthase II (cobalamin-independent)